MCTNIERAINDLVLSNKDITLENALPAYLREAGFEVMSPDALVAFEHVLDKCPTRRLCEAFRGSSITQEYWSGKHAVLADTHCAYCDACAPRLLNLGAEGKGRGCERQEEEEEKMLKRPLKSSSTTRKKGRRVRVKRDVVTAVFDPSAPSTSTITL